MLNKRSWEDFQNAGLFWWINRSLHLFGWCLVYEENEMGEIVNVYPAHTSARGFSERDELEGFEKLTHELYLGVDAMTSEVALAQMKLENPEE